LRKKLERLVALDADLYVIQECEDPSQCASVHYREWAANHLWTGTNKNRGLGVFAKPRLHLEAVPLSTSPLELFLPCRVNDSVSLVAVWTRQANSPTFRYIGQLWKFLQVHSQFLKAEHSLLIGDLNSNACWDVWDRWWNHTDVVNQLRDLGLQSIYHLARKESQGQESTPTFYMYRKRDRPYHIDYAFLSEALVCGATCDVGDPSLWLEISDHMPVVVEVPALSLSGSCRPDEAFQGHG